jgi:Ca2+/Na+ antiporter
MSATTPTTTAKKPSVEEQEKLLESLNEARAKPQPSRPSSPTCTFDNAKTQTLMNKVLPLVIGIVWIVVGSLLITSGLLKPDKSLDTIQTLTFMSAGVMLVITIFYWLTAIWLPSQRSWWFLKVMLVIVLLAVSIMSFVVGVTIAPPKDTDASKDQMSNLQKATLYTGIGLAGLGGLYILIKIYQARRAAKAARGQRQQ